MDLSFEQRKTAFANAILKLKDERVLVRLQEALGKELQEEQMPEPVSPMSMEEFRAMIAQSEADIQAGHYVSAEAVKKEIATW